MEACGKPAKGSGVWVVVSRALRLPLPMHSWPTCTQGMP